MLTRDIAISALIHAALLAIFVAAGALAVRQAPTPRGIEMQVIESPKLAPAAARAAPKRPKEKTPTQSPVENTDQVVAGSKESPPAPVSDSKITSDSPGAQAGLPQATEEYLVSRMPILAADFRVPYPPEAKKRGVQGSVIFDLLIDSEGRVRDATLIQGPGAGLNEAAAAAVRELRFRPAQVNDRPVAVKIRYAYRFVLER